MENYFGEVLNQHYTKGLESPKVKFIELIAKKAKDENRGPVLIFSSFNGPLKDLHAKFINKGYICGLLTGDETEE